METLSDSFIEGVGFLSLDAIKPFYSELFLNKINILKYKELFLKNINSNIQYCDINPFFKYKFYNSIINKVDFSEYLFTKQWTEFVYEYKSSDRFGEAYFHSILRNLSKHENLAENIQKEILLCFNDYKQKVDTLEKIITRITISNDDDKLILEYFNWDIENLGTNLYNICANNIFTICWKKYINPFNIEDKENIWRVAKLYNKKWSIRDADVPFPGSWELNLKFFLE